MNEWEKKIGKFLVGRKVVEVRYMTDEEMEQHCWDRKALIIFFDDGSYIYSSADDEGNQAGALFTSSNEVPVIPVF